MIHKVFAIFDTKAKSFLPPFYLPEQGMAVRAFADGINDVTHQFGKHPEDYALFQLAAFDDVKGIFIGPELGAELVVAGLQLVIPRSNKE